MISSTITPERPQFRRDEKLSTNASAHLDMMRGIATPAVLFGHGRNLFFGNYTGRQAMELVTQRGLGIGEPGGHSILYLEILLSPCSFNNSRLAWLIVFLS
jgi:hypothetical protein